MELHRDSEPLGQRTLLGAHSSSLWVLVFGMFMALLSGCGRLAPVGAAPSDAAVPAPERDAGAEDVGADAGAPDTASQDSGQDSAPAPDAGCAASGLACPAGFSCSPLGCRRPTLTASYLDACTIDADGGVICWGDDMEGELGIGPSASSMSPPVAVMGLGAPAASLSCEYWSCCVLDVQGNVQCWGDLGPDPTDIVLAPTAEPTGGFAATPVLVRGTTGHYCGLLSDGTVQCWGADDVGELGNGTTSATPLSAAQNVVGIIGATDLAVGYESACALTASGVQCWGGNLAGELGNVGGSGSDTPVSVPTLDAPFVSLGGGGDAWSMYCGLTAAGEVACWGGFEDGPAPQVLTTVSGLPASVVSLSVGGDHACVVTAQGKVSCWGVNTNGALGNGVAASGFPFVANPVDVVGLPHDDPVVEVSAGSAHTCAKTESGAVYCWGSDEQDGLGNGQGNSATPVLVNLP